MRKIPSTIATQHPDNASIPYWGKNPFISTIDEVRECYRVFSDLDCDEYMWDWEGKFVDEAVVDRLLHRYEEYFRKKQLGRDKFLTFRVPNIWHEKGHRLARAYMTMITAAHTAKEYRLHTPPLFEVILPMTTDASQLLMVIKKYREALKYEKAIFEEVVAGLGKIEMIPLIEGSVTLLKSRRILHEYVRGYEKLFKYKPPYLRPFIARSDPALDAGFIPAVLSARAAISEYYRFEEESGIPVYPIIGVGSLPFRGGLSPTRLGRFLENYAGVRTVTIQSAFRYDYPLPQVKKAIRFLNHGLRRHRAVLFSDKEIREMTTLAEQFSALYRPVIRKLAPMINDIVQYVPSHRERIPHSGHFGYSRSMEKQKIKLPRAIAFVAVFASLGVPPTFIGTGRGLRSLIEQGKEKLLQKYLPTLREDIEDTGRYLNWENLKFLIRENPAWAPIREDVLFLEEFLGKRLGPEKPDQFIHRNLTSNIYHLWKQGKPEELRKEILHAGQVRRSLG
ncbi:MAG: phosphoenolpyruvate carboxylase [Deltaproteobacteria bacterium]|nr:phosphoenolpyruvate carboxylase [Deltaproteobacteria bacterium]